MMRWFSSVAKRSPTQTSDKTPVLLYSHAGDWKPYAAYFAGIGQFVFWLSLADMSWRELGPGGKGIPNTDDSPSTSKKEPKLLDQYGYTAFCVITGLGIPLLINSYFSRRLTGLAVMPNKRSALIETQALFGTRQRVVPLQGMKMIHSTMTSFEGRTHPRHDILLTSPSLKWGAYVADKKGRFEELRLWDYLFYRP